MGYKVAVVGATGNVGREILNVLVEREFPYDEIAAIASSRSHGSEIELGETDKMLKEHGDKVSAEERGKVESAVSNLREVAKNDDEDAIQKAIDTLMQASQEIGKTIYEDAAKAAEAAAPAGADQPADAAGETDADEGVIDAEFEVKDAK